MKKQDVLIFQSAGGGGTATIMILGDTCTRGYKFCAVSTGKPFLPDPFEPQRIAEAVKEWGLRYVVITSVCRDDLDDGGAGHMAKTIKAIKSACPAIKVESLIPDFAGKVDSIQKIVESGPEVTISRQQEGFHLKLGIVEPPMTNLFQF